MAGTCAVIATVTGAATPPGGGGLADVATATATLWQVRAQLMGSQNPVNDGSGLIDQPIIGTVATTRIVDTGYVTGYRDSVSYTLILPFIDQLFIGAVQQAPPYSLYWLVTEDYVSALGFGSSLTFGQVVSASPSTITKKIRPLSSGGPIQAIDTILI